VKQFLLVLAFIFLGDLAITSFSQVEGTNFAHSLTHLSASSSHCHDSQSVHTTDKPAGLHAALKHQGCCPALGINRTERSLLVDNNSSFIVISWLVPTYSDVTYTIDKPPKIAT
jgi:hypothetical protein